MSNKNTLEQKKLRRMSRENSGCHLAETEQVTDLPKETSAAVLVDPKEKMTRSMRKTWMRSRDSIVLIVRKDPKPDADKLVDRMELLPLAKLLRRRKQATERAAIFKGRHSRAVVDHIKSNLYRAWVWQQTVIATCNQIINDRITVKP